MANTSLTINFSTQADGTDENGNDLFIDIELDDELNNDKSSFEFGATVYLRVFTNCSTIDFYPSEGSVLPATTTLPPTDGHAEVTEIITFTQPPESAGGVVADNTASLSYPVSSNFSAVKLGSGAGCGSISVDPTDSSTAVASQAGPGVYTATYNAVYASKSIVGPSAPTGWDSEETYPVVVVVVGS